MNEQLFKELENLILKKGDHEKFLQRLKENNSSCEDVMKIERGFDSHYPDNDIVLVLIAYYESKVKELNEKINKFHLYKSIN